MPYLTQEEYKDMTGVEAPADFKKLAERASAELDVLTRFYYVHNDLNSDVEWRKRQFKRALVAQIDFFHALGTSSSDEMNSMPDSVRIGDTTVTYNSRAVASEANKRQTAISLDALNLLKSTGLLYRGASGYGV